MDILTHRFIYLHHHHSYGCRMLPLELYEICTCTHESETNHCENKLVIYEWMSGGVSS